MVRGGGVAGEPGGNPNCLRPVERAGRAEQASGRVKPAPRHRTRVPGQCGRQTARTASARTPTDDRLVVPSSRNLRPHGAAHETTLCRVNFGRETGLLNEL